MLKALIPLAVPFGVTLAGVAAVRLVAGPERGARWAALAAVLGVLVGWGVLTELPWVPKDALARVLHIAVGGALVGALLEAINPRAGVAVIALAIYALVCGLASIMPGGGAGGGISATSLGALGVKTLALGLLLAGMWFAVAAKLRSMSAHPPTALTVALAAAFGLVALALAVGDRAVVGAALALALPLLGVGVAALLWDLRLNIGIVLMSAGGLVALGWALAQRQPNAVLGLALLVFVLYAERTARRIPMPAAKVKGALYVAALGGICALPIVLAVVLTLAAVK